MAAYGTMTRGVALGQDQPVGPSKARSALQILVASPFLGAGVGMAVAWFAFSQPGNRFLPLAIGAFAGGVGGTMLGAGGAVATAVSGPNMRLVGDAGYGYSMGY